MNIRTNYILSQISECVWIIWCPVCGDGPYFAAATGALSCDIAPDPELAAQFIHVNPVHRGTQVGCEMSEHEVSYQPCLPRPAVSLSIIYLLPIIYFGNNRYILHLLINHV